MSGHYPAWGGDAWVIFEGPDGAGKSTMARRTAGLLADRSPTILQHLTSRSALNDYYEPARLWQRGGLNVVQDRYLVSDLVYAPVLSGVASRLGKTEVLHGMAQTVHRAVVIYVTAEEEVLARRLVERGDDLIDPGMLHAILKNYHREMGGWEYMGAVVHTVDTSADYFLSDLELELTLAVAFEELASERGG